MAPVTTRSGAVVANHATSGQAGCFTPREYAKEESHDASQTDPEKRPRKAGSQEPITYDNIRGYTQLARELKTPLQLGENIYGPRLLYQAILAGAGDYFMPDMMRIDGVSGWLRAAAITSAAGVPMSTHLYPEISAHLMRVTDTAHWLEWQNWANPVLMEPFEIKDGFLVVPDRPGQGIEWDEKAVTKFAY